ncbi:MAG: VTT domain-containing protein [Solirubrobacterales bacterium]|nr:VTT domain-containing protein [Solirubrobacterales bacterium]
MSSHEITQLVQQYGYLLVFAAVAMQALCLPLPGTTVLVAAALYAATSHHLEIAGVIAAGALGALTGTTAGFALGRQGGERLLLALGRRLRQSPERINHLRGEFADHGGAWLVVGRFITGIRNIAGLMAGASGMTFRRFLAFSSAAALAWASLNALEYFWFGKALAAASSWVQIVLICAGIGWLVFSVNLLRRRALRRLDSVPREKRMLPNEQPG